MSAPPLSDGATATLEAWLVGVLSTPGLTALRDATAARRALLDDALRAVELVEREEGPVIDVGSGGGTPGIPLAAALPDRRVTLLEAERRKCRFLEGWTGRLPNVEVVWGRAEEQPLETHGVAVAKALAHPPTAAEWLLPLAHPPTAAEWLLPLVVEGGIAILWVGETADVAAVARVAERLAARPEPAPPGLVVLRKTGPTPPGFPRRVGVARKRPLA